MNFANFAVTVVGTANPLSTEQEDCLPHDRHLRLAVLTSAMTATATELAPASAPAAALRKIGTAS